MMVALASEHPIARRGDPVALAELAGERWATPWEDTAYASMIVRACRAAGFEPDVRHRVTDLHTLLDLARGGLAVTLVPRLGGAAEGSWPRAAAARRRRAAAQPLRRGAAQHDRPSGGRRAAGR